MMYLGIRQKPQVKSLPHRREPIPRSSIQHCFCAVLHQTNLYFANLAEWVPAFAGMTIWFFCLYSDVIPTNATFVSSYSYVVSSKWWLYGSLK